MLISSHTHFRPRIVGMYFFSFFFFPVRSVFFLTRVCTYSLGYTPSFLSFFSDSLLRGARNRNSSVSSPPCLLSCIRRIYSFYINVISLLAVKHIYVHVHIHKTATPYSVYVCCYRETFSDAVKTKKAITLPPNDFEKNERLCANEKD